MGLRETFCKGVYCQQHNPDMPAGNYKNLKHYVWNALKHEMVEIPNVFYISSSGREAYHVAEFQAYRLGYNFTDKRGVYEKDGHFYKFNSETMEFEQIK